MPQLPNGTPTGGSDPLSVEQIATRNRLRLEDPATTDMGNVPARYAGKILLPDGALTDNVEYFQNIPAGWARDYANQLQRSGRYLVAITNPPGASVSAYGIGALTDANARAIMAGYDENTGRPLPAAVAPAAVATTPSVPAATPSATPVNPPAGMVAVDSVSGVMVPVNPGTAGPTAPVFASPALVPSLIGQPDTYAVPVSAMSTVRTPAAMAPEGSQGLVENGGGPPLPTGVVKEPIPMWVKVGIGLLVLSAVLS